MKKLNSLLFVFIVLVAFVFNSCGSDNDNDPTDPITEETITVQNKLKNQFFKIDNIAFQFINDKEVHVWTEIVNNGESYKYTKSTYTVYQDKDYIGIKGISTIIHYLLISNNIQYYTDQKHSNEITTEVKPNIYEEKDKNPIDPTIEETTLVQNKIKGLFFKIDNVAVQFINDKEVHVWTDIVNNGEFYKYQKNTYVMISDKEKYIHINGASIRIYYSITSNNIQFFDENKENEIIGKSRPNDYKEEDKRPIENDWRNMKLNTLIIDGITHSDIKYKFDTESQISVHDNRNIYIYKKDANMDTWLMGGESSLELSFSNLHSISDLLSKDLLDKNLCAAPNNSINGVHLRNYLTKEDRLGIWMNDDKHTKKVIKIVEQNKETKNIKLYIDIIGYIIDKQNNKDIDITIQGLIEVRTKMRE